MFSILPLRSAISSKKKIKMKYLNVLLLILTYCIGFTQKENEKHLFKIVDDNKVGFIDSSGTIIIEPIYFAAGEFNEGFAYARVNGRYGYIDKSGEYVIEPQFDYANSFKGGLAIVYENGQPYFINKSGHKEFDCSFPLIGEFQNECAIVKTETNKYGAINKKGELVIDTVFKSMTPFIDGLSVVYGLNHSPFSSRKLGVKKNFEIGVIDTLGQFIIPYGRFKSIEGYSNGYFIAEIPAEPWDTILGYTAQTAIINKTGNIIITKDHKNHCYLAGNLHCGLAKMYLYKYWIPEEKGILSTSTKSYQGFMNSKGEIQINDTTFKYVEDFSDNRAFVRDDNRHYSIINTKGDYIAESSFDGVVGKSFKNGVAFVSENRKWGLIDTNANYLIQPQFEGIHDIGIIDDYFFFEESDPNIEAEYDYLYGVADLSGKILIKPILQSFDQSGFINGLLKCIIDKKLTYIDKAGTVVWQEKESISKQLSNLNIDFMNRGYFHAYSLPNKKQRSGGWATSENIPRKIKKSYNFPANSLSVVVNMEQVDTIFQQYNGISVYVANTSKHEISFKAQDSRLYMKVQALNCNGEWKDIEYLPNSWCGNSYHSVTLKSNYFWTFKTPIYEGDFKTKLRIELKYIDQDDTSETQRKKEEIIVYSNEFEGSVNPGQFWRKREYFSNGIMDPYDE